MPSDFELSVMECYKEVVKPIVDMTEAIRAEKWVTILIFLPFLLKLFTVHLKLATADSHLVGMKEAIYSDLQGCCISSALEVPTKVAFLNPRFKAISFLVLQERKHIHL